MGASLKQREEMARKTAAILRALKDGPLDGNTLRERAEIPKTAAIRALAVLREENKIVMVGQKRGAKWQLVEGIVPRKTYTRSNGHAPVKNTRPAKSNGQVGSAVSELREVIARKQEDLDSLNRSLVILEASL